MIELRRSQTDVTALESAEQRWRRVNAPQLVAAVLHGIKFKDGQRVSSTPGAPSTDQETGKVAA